MTNHFPPDDNHHSAQRQRSGKGSGVLIVLLLVAIAVMAGGIFMRIHEATALNRTTKEAAIPDVVVIKAPRAPVTEDIALPGNVQAWHESPIYARTSGYLKDWKTDIGAQVKTGDLIAEIETPEVDAQLHQAEADLATANANNQLAQSTAQRWDNLLKTGSVSKQDADDKAGAAAASLATVASAKANVDRLRQLEGFKRIVAPFDGVITARNTDNGALINAGSSGTGPELFHIAETDKLRVYVQVPETYVQAVTPGLTAELVFAEHPGQTFPAKLAHSADALDPTTRTLLLQLEVDNDKGVLLPGGYAEVHLKVPAAADTVMLPVNTLLFRSAGMQVATVGDDGKASLKSITIGRDYGTKVEVVSGISPDETIIVNPPDSLTDGQKVHVVQPGQDKGNDRDGKKGDGKDSGDTTSQPNSNDDTQGSKTDDKNDNGKDSSKPDSSTSDSKQ
jgi:RND family efflux transporter MFP subunit